MARPKLNIDPGMVERMAIAGNTIEDMATILQCSRDTLEKRFSANIQKGRAIRRQGLRDMMLNTARSGNAIMQIFLSKQSEKHGGLEYSDKIETKIDATITPGEPITKEAIEAALKADKFLKGPTD